jgi:hypothetical protein
MLLLLMIAIRLSPRPEAGRAIVLKSCASENDSNKNHDSEDEHPPELDKENERHGQDDKAAGSYCPRESRSGYDDSEAGLPLHWCELTGTVRGFLGLE